MDNALQIVPCISKSLEVCNGSLNVCNYIHNLYGILLETDKVTVLQSVYYKCHRFFFVYVNSFKTYHIIITIYYLSLLYMCVLWMHVSFTPIFILFYT